MLAHRCGRAHAIEELEAAAVPLDQLPAGLIMTSQHAAQHHEVGPSPESFRHVAWARAAAVGDDVAAQTVCRVCALNHCRQLWVADPSLLASRTDGARPNADLEGAKEELELTCRLR